MSLEMIWDFIFCSHNCCERLYQRPTHILRELDSTSNLSIDSRLPVVKSASHDFMESYNCR